MRIFRVEHKITEMGPYTFNNDLPGDEQLEICEELDEAHGWDLSEHPTPTMEGMPWMGEGQISAGPSIEWLKEWFRGFWWSLGAVGFVVREYEIWDCFVKIGPKSGQIVFPKQCARVIETHDMVTT